MVCCAIITGLLAAIFWLCRHIIPGKRNNAPSPLAWRLADTDTPEILAGTKARSKPTRFTPRARLASFSYAFSGLKRVIKTEHNAWLHLAATVLVIGAGAAFKISLNDWTWLVIAIGWVWTAEIVNTAIEQVCDAVSLECNTMIGAAKDIAAGAVLVSAIGATIIGVLRLGPYLMAQTDLLDLPLSWCTVLAT